MNNAQKAQIYDECLRESDQLQRTNSKLKGEYVGDIPPNIQKIIDDNNSKITIIVKRLESLFK
jgi:hypothetical protein